MTLEPLPATWRSERQGIILLITTVLLLLVLPWADVHRHGRIAATALFLVMVAVGLGGALDRGWGRIGWFVGLLAVAWLCARITILTVPLADGTELHLAPFLGLILALLILANIFRALTAAQRISAGVLAEAFTGYLLVALAFAELYSTLGSLFPNAFNSLPPPGADAAQYAYFSLVTLASVGFGDIVPVHPFVRMVAALEGVCGSFYTAVIIARLVAAYRPRRRRSSPALELDRKGG